MRKLIRLVALLMCLAKAQAAVHIAPDLSWASLTNSLLTNTVLPGDTVVWPAGSNAVTQPFPKVTKPIWLKLAGTDDSRPVSTNVTQIYFDNPNANVALFQFAVTSNAIAAANFRPRISGGQFRQHTSAASQNKLIYVTSPVMRIDHCEFDNIRKDCIQFITSTGTNGPVGLVDNCSFYTTPSSVNANALRVIGGPSNDATTIRQTLGAWSVPPPWGTTNMVMVEDIWAKYLNRGNSIIDIYASGKVGLRHSHVFGTDCGNHGNDSGGYWSALLFEMYNVIFDQRGVTGIPLWGQFRGGSVRISDCELYYTNPSTHPRFDLEVYRASYNSIYPWTVCETAFKPWGLVTGTSTNTAFGVGCPPNPLDGMQDWTGYPALCQPGFVGPITFGATNTTMVSQPCYEWNNTAYGPGGSVSNANFFVQNRTNNVGLPTANQLIISGRDFFNDTTNSYAKLSYPHPWIAVDSAYEATWGLSNAPMFFSTNSPTPPIPPEPPPSLGTNVPVRVEGVMLVTPDVIIKSE